MMPKISVIMPTYNADKHLREAIDSILSQTESNFEFFIIDDSSTDNTLKIINSYTDKRIKLLHGPCKGISVALNLGLDVATGEFIARMNADDISLPTRFEKQIQFLTANPDIGLVGVFAEFLFENPASFVQEKSLYGDGTDSFKVPGLLDALLCCPTVSPDNHVSE